MLIKNYKKVKMSYTNINQIISHWIFGQDLYTPTIEKFKKNSGCVFEVKITKHHLNMLYQNYSKYNKNKVNKTFKVKINIKYTL